MLSFYNNFQKSQLKQKTAQTGGFSDI